jgi:hypothetical protein
MPMIKSRIASPALLVGINAIQGLDYIREEEAS